MERAELKKWAKEKIKGHIWEILIPIIVAGILSSLTIGQKVTFDEGTLHFDGGVSLGLFFYSLYKLGLHYSWLNLLMEKKENSRIYSTIQKIMYVSF